MPKRWFCEGFALIAACGGLALWATAMGMSHIAMLPASLAGFVAATMICVHRDRGVH